MESYSVCNHTSDEQAGVRFVNHEYDYRLNWTTRSPITTINRNQGCMSRSNCGPLTIDTPGVSDQLKVPKSPIASPTQTPVKTSSLETRPVRKKTTCVNSDSITGIVVEKEYKWFLI